MGNKIENTIKKCIELLGVDGKNTKAQVREILEGVISSLHFSEEIMKIVMPKAEDLFEDLTFKLIGDRHYRSEILCGVEIEFDKVFELCRITKDGNESEVVFGYNTIKAIHQQMLELGWDL